MAKYNGHRSWNAWNVSLWISNDEKLYREAMSLLHRSSADRAAQAFTARHAGAKTPDGATYNITCVREAMRGLKE